MDRPTYKDCSGCNALIKTEVKTRVPVTHSCGRSKDEMLLYVQKQKELYDYNARKSFYYNVYWKKVKDNIDDHKSFPDPALDKMRAQSSKKILIIGQAPPAVNQTIPYDTTMLYTWLDAVGIDKHVAQALFEFDAVYGEFPGYDENGGHLKPTFDQMMDHYTKGGLAAKVVAADKVLLLGRVAFDFFAKVNLQLSLYFDTPDGDLAGKKVLQLMHPSKRNIAAYKKDQENLHRLLKEFIEQ